MICTSAALMHIRCITYMAHSCSNAHTVHGTQLPWFSHSSWHAVALILIQWTAHGFPDAHTANSTQLPWFSHSAQHMTAMMFTWCTAALMLTHTWNITARMLTQYRTHNCPVAHTMQGTWLPWCSHSDITQETILWIFGKSVTYKWIMDCLSYF